MRSHNGGYSGIVKKIIKLKKKVKDSSEIDGDLIMIMIWLDCEHYGKNQCKKGSTITTFHRSKCWDNI